MALAHDGPSRVPVRWAVRIVALLLLLLAGCSPTGEVGDGSGGDGGPAGGQDAAGAQDAGTVSMARATWDTGFMQAYVYRDLLEELGYDVSDPSEATVDANVFYPALARGQYDVWVNGWFPLHDIYLERELFTGEQDEQPVTPVGTEVSGGALQGYLVDRKTADEMDLTSMSDLADAEVAATFDDDGNGKADLIGCNEGWGCNTAIAEHIDQLDWGANVEQVVGEYSDLIADVQSDVEAGEPVLFYTWTPNWTVDVLVPGEDVVWLESPAPPDTDGETTVDGLEGCATGAGSCDLGWVANDIRVVGSNDFLDANPSARRLFELVEIPLDDIDAQNAEMYEGGDSYTEDDIAQDAADWIEENGSTVDRWLDEARSAG